MYEDNLTLKLMTGTTQIGLVAMSVVGDWHVCAELYLLKGRLLSLRSGVLYC